MDSSLPAAASPAPTPKRSRVLWLLLAVCLAPVVASYLAYYVLPPSKRSNYGDLLEPQRPVNQVAVTTLEGQPTSLAALKGSWVMVQLAPAVCEAACQQRLWWMRQVRATTGKERDRVQRVWLVTDAGTPDAALLREYEGTMLWRVTEAQRQALFAADAESATEHVWLVDPLGNLMLRWPQEVNPSRMKKDLERVLRASRVG